MKENTLTHSFQNHYSKHTHSSGFSLWGDQDVQLRKGFKGCKPKSFYLFFLLDKTPAKKSPRPSPDHIPHIGIKLPLTDFRRILSKMLGHIFRYTIMTYLKKFVGTKFFITKKCIAGSSPIMIPPVSPFLLKMHLPLMLLCCSHQVWTAPFPQTFVGNPGDGGRIPPNSQKFTHFPQQKNLS